VGFWTWLILVLALLWMVQIAGTYYQMRHYRKVLGGITREESEGYVGVGNAKAWFGKGVILILVSGEDGIVRRALRMRGMTVFARFREAPNLIGLSIDDLREARDEEKPESRYEKGTMLAARRAVEQIDRIRAEKMGSTVKG
jgi:glucitol operon activator protein